MKIKEVEKLTGMSIANIRFYEKEGLLHPQRDEENNYRQYTQEEVRRIEEIKKLRLLGIAISDIKDLFEEQVSLSEILKKRLEGISQEQRNLELVESVCQDALKKNIELDTLDELAINENSNQWQRRLAVVLMEDTTKEVITRKQLNTHIMMMTMYGYVLAAVSFLLVRGKILGCYGVDLTEYGDLGLVEVMEVVGITVLILVSILVNFTANMKIQIVLFHIGVILQAPVLMILLMGYDEITEGMYHLMPISLIAIAGYAFVIGMLANANGKVLMKAGISMLCWLAFEVLYVIAMVLTQSYVPFIIVMSVMFGLVSMVITLEWTFANQDQSCYNRYDAVLVTSKLTNIFACMFERGGYSSWRNFRR